MVVEEEGVAGEVVIKEGVRPRRGRHREEGAEEEEEVLSSKKERGVIWGGPSSPFQLLARGAAAILKM